jgi:hypothetical protein
MTELLYLIGEAILLEVEGVKNIKYPVNNEEPTILFIEIEESKHYELTLKASNDN